MKALDRSRRTVAAAGALLGLAGLGAGAGVWLHARPVLHLASSARECVSAPDHLASLFSDDQNTLIRISNLDYSDLRVLRVEPAATLPGMFDSLLALSGDSARLAYVTAADEQMDGASIQYLDVAGPADPHPLVSLAQGLAPVRPAWSPDASQLAYVVGRPGGYEVWSADAAGVLPPRKVADLPIDVFGRGHAASLCWTAAGQIGLLEGVESARGQVGPSPLTGPGAVSAARTRSPEPGDSPCGVPVLSQNDPTWSQLVMQAGGDPIGGFGCALTSAAMLLDHYGASLSPADLNACLGGAADPIIWQQAPVCTAGKVAGGVRTDFSWDALDAYLGAGKPVIVGMVRGFTGMHFVVVTRGGGGAADDYGITDPWDGTTTKSLGSYIGTGYNPRWIVSFDGQGQGCGRLLRPVAPPVGGFSDGGTYRHPVLVRVPPGGATVRVQQPGSAPRPPPLWTPTPGTIAVIPGTSMEVSGEGAWMVVTSRGPGQRPIVRMFTIDTRPPSISVEVVDHQRGRLRLHAVDTGSGVAGVEYDLDHAGFVPYSDDVSFVRTLAVPAAGTHAISVRAVDLAGNRAELDDQSFDVAGVPSGPTPTPTPVPSRPPSARPATPTPTPSQSPSPSPSAVPLIAIAPLQVGANPPPPAGTLPPCPASYTVATSIRYGGTGTATAGWLEDGQLVKESTFDFSPARVDIWADVVAVPGPNGKVPRTIQLEFVSPQLVKSNLVTLDCQGGT